MSMQRFTITLEDSLAQQFEQFRKKQGYSNRSEAFRDLLREHLAGERQTRDLKGDCTATLSYIYDHHQRDLAARMTQLSHDHHDLTVSTLHIHLDHDNCLETMVLQGSLERVQAFADSVIAQPGVRHGKLNSFPVEAISQEHQHGKMKSPHSHIHIKPIS
jgi:CopG family transcriptional regulator, nickel-responsive regulator